MHSMDPFYWHDRVEPTETWNQPKNLRPENRSTTPTPDCGKIENVMGRFLAGGCELIDSGRDSAGFSPDTCRV